MSVVGLLKVAIIVVINIELYYRMVKDNRNSCGTSWWKKSNKAFDLCGEQQGREEQET